jgi:hypothetical protein
VMALLKTGCQFISRILIQAGEELGVHPGDSLRGVLQSFAVGVFTNRVDDRGNGLVDFLFVDQLLILPSNQALRWVRFVAQGEIQNSIETLSNYARKPL